MLFVQTLDLGFEGLGGAGLFGERLDAAVQVVDLVAAAFDLGLGLVGSTVSLVAGDSQFIDQFGQAAHFGTDVDQIVVAAFVLGGFGLAGGFEPGQVLAQIGTDTIDFFEPAHCCSEQIVEVVLFVLQSLRHVSKFLAFGGSGFEQGTNPGEFAAFFVQFLTNAFAGSLGIGCGGELVFEADDAVTQVSEHAVAFIELAGLAFEVGFERGDFADEFVASRACRDRVDAGDVLFHIDTAQILACQLVLGFEVTEAIVDFAEQATDEVIDDFVIGLLAVRFGALLMGRRRLDRRNVSDRVDRVDTEVGNGVVHVVPVVPKVGLGVWLIAVCHLSLQSLCTRCSVHHFRWLRRLDRRCYWCSRVERRERPGKVVMCPAHQTRRRDRSDRSYPARVQKPQTGPKLAAVLLVIVALIASACGSDAEEITSEELFAPSDDQADLNTKPPVADEFLVDVSELTITDLIEGDGDVALSGSVVAMQYVGVLADGGTQFDASWDRGAEPLSFALDTGRVIPGWDEGIQGMKVGGRRVLQIPSDQAYGDRSPSPDIPADSDLVFIVDLVSVDPPPEPTPTPIPAPPIPEDALGAFDELGIIDLVEGSGPEIVRGDIVSVQYVGVTAANGEEFDSSWSRGAVPFTLIAGTSGVIEGWQQGLLGAKVGGERVLQIPAAQAYDEADLVFRVHIEEVEPAPLAHQVTFGGVAPTEVETETLVEGTGDGAEEGDVVTANVVVLRYSDSDIIQSTYQSGNVTPLFVSPEGLLPGLNDAMIGVKGGETRQIVLPANIAFPDGVPADAGIAADDALVFVVAAIDVNELESE